MTSERTPDSGEEPTSEGSSWSSPGRILDRLQARPPAETRYDIGQEIARGGMGAILRVWDGDLRRALAMKVALGRGSSGSSSVPGSSLDDRTLGRFLDEAQITAQLDHPGIVPVHELGVDEKGQVFFTMALVRGDHFGVVLKDLHGEKLDEGTSLPEGEWTQTRVLGVLLKVCEAMSYAHAKGVLHRDLKPANVMVGGFGQVYVMDWGLARVLDRPEPAPVKGKARPATRVQSDRREAAAGDMSSPLLTMDGDVVGTPAYMSPEQARAEWGAVGPPTDVYAIGAILYHVLAGHMPYGQRGGKERPGVEVWQAVRKGPPPALARFVPNAPPELVAICEKAMERDPEDRYPDTSALGKDLRAYLEGRVVSAYATGPINELRKWITRNKALAATAALAILASVGGLLGAAWVQVNANAVLADRNKDLQEARAESERQAGLLRLDGAALREARAENERALAAARWEAYIGAITAAALSLEAGNLAEMRRQLDACPEDLRGWEWSHFDLAQDASLDSLTHLPEHVGFVTFHPDGQRILVGGRHGRISIHGLKEGEGVDLDTAGHAPRAGAFSTDGTRVLVGSVNGSLILYRTQDGSVERVLEEGGSDFAGVHAWNHHASERHGFVSFDNDGHLRAWEDDGSLLAERDLPVATFFGAQSAFMATDVADHVGRIAILKVGGGIEVVDVPSLETVAELVTDQLAIRHALHPDGDRVAVLTVDGRIGELSLDSRRAPDWADTRSGENPVRVDYMRRGDRVVGAFRDRTVRVMTTPGLETVNNPARTLGDPRFALDPAGERMVTYDTSPVKLWHLWAQADAVSLDLPNPARQVELGPEGDRVAVLSLGARDVQFFDARSGDALGRFATRRGALNAMAFDPTWRLAAVATARGELSLWSPGTGELERELLGHEGRILSLAFSPDGRVLASGGRDGTVRLWQTASGRLLSILTQQQTTITVVAFHPGGQALAWGDASGVIVLFDLITGERNTVQVEEGASVRTLAFSPTGEWLVMPAEGKDVRVMRLSDLGTVSILRGHTEAISSIEVFPGSQRIVTADDDGDLRIWDPVSGRGLAVLDGHSGTVADLAVRADGARIASVGLDETLRFWDSSVEDARHAWDGAASRHAARADLVTRWLELGDLDQALARFNVEPELRPFADTAARLVEDWRASEGDVLAELLWERTWPRFEAPERIARIARVTRDLLDTFPSLSVPVRSYLLDIQSLCALRRGDLDRAGDLLAKNRSRRGPGRKNTSLPSADEMEMVRELLKLLLLVEEGETQAAREGLAALPRPNPSADRSLRALHRELRGRLEE